MNRLEQLIAFVSPTMALERERARQITSHIRSFDAAKKGRRTASWLASGTSANAEIYAASSILRNRSRELTRNNPFVKRAVQSISNNTIGVGIRVKVISKNKRERERLQKTWTDWSDKTECDFEDRLNFGGIQKLVFRAVIESGDCLILKRRNKDKKVPLELQVLEIDYLDISKNSLTANSGGDYSFMGIEFNGKGKRIGYWLFDRHPNDVNTIGNTISRLVPASDVIHVYELLRAGQQLGVPFGVSAFLRVRDMDEYNDAQVVRQKIAACYTVNITREGAGTVLDASSTSELERVEPGMINVLNPGETIAFGTPPSVEGFGEFSRAIMQGVAAGFGLTYETLTGDLSNVNFSSGRMGWIEMHRNIEDWQWNVIIPQLCDPVWKWFVEAAELVGVTSVSSTAEWTPPRRQMIDPAKEIKGINAQIRNGLISWNDAVREQGYDPEEVLLEIAATNKALDEAKIILDCDPRKGKGEAPDGRGRPATDAENLNDNVDKK